MYSGGDGYLDKLCVELVGLPSSRNRPPTLRAAEWRSDSSVQGKEEPGVRRLPVSSVSGGYVVEPTTTLLTDQTRRPPLPSAEMHVGDDERARHVSDDKRRVGWSHTSRRDSLQEGSPVGVINTESVDGAR